MKTTGMRTQSIAVLGTGGGSGQSTAAIFLAKEIANSGKTVCLVDLNLSNPTLHTYCLLKQPSRSLNKYLEQGKKLEEVILKTDYRGLYLLAGNLSLNLSSKFEKVYAQFLETISQSTFDYIVFDLNLENQAMTLDTLCWADERIFVTETNPNRIENFYTLTQKMLLRKIKSLPYMNKHYPLLKHVLIQDKSLFMEALQEIAVQDAMAKKEILPLVNSLHSFILLNKVNDTAEGKIIEQLAKRLKKTLGLRFSSMGYMEWSEEVRCAWRQHKTLLDVNIEWKNQNVVSFIKHKAAEVRL